MGRRLYVVTLTLAACLFASTGFCFIEESIPESGSTVAGGEGESVSFYCRVLREINGTQVTTEWFIERIGAGGSGPQTIVANSNFEITGEPIPSLPAGLNSQTNLTIRSLTSDLDRANLSCGRGGTPPTIDASFILRIYRPPNLLDNQQIVVVEGTPGTINLQQAPDAFPFPQQFSWTANNNSRVAFGYPSVTFLPFIRGDAGTYTLTATNYRLDNTSVVVGTDTGSFTLDVQSQCTGNFSAQSGNYRVSYVVQGNNVTFSVSARTTGWVAIGVSNDNRMPNTDVIVGAADGTGFFVDDRFATGRFQPPVDSSQDITNSMATVENGVVTMNFTRPRNSSDSRDISLDQCRFLLYAYGTSATVSSRNFLYHGTTRGVLSANFCIPSANNCPAPTQEPATTQTPTTATTSTPTLAETCRALDTFVDNVRLLTCIRNDQCNGIYCNVTDAAVRSFISTANITLLPCNQPPAFRLSTSGSTVLDRVISQSVNISLQQGITLGVTLDHLTNVVGVGVNASLIVFGVTSSIVLAPYTRIPIDTSGCSRTPTTPPPTTSLPTTPPPTTPPPTTSPPTTPPPTTPPPTTSPPTTPPPTTPPPTTPPPTTPPPTTPPPTTPPPTTPPPTTPPPTTPPPTTPPPTTPPPTTPPPTTPPPTTPPPTTPPPTTPPPTTPPPTTPPPTTPPPTTPPPTTPPPTTPPPTTPPPTTPPPTTPPPTTPPPTTPPPTTPPPTTPPPTTPPPTTPPPTTPPPTTPPPTTPPPTTPPPTTPPPTTPPPTTPPPTTPPPATPPPTTPPPTTPPPTTPPPTTPPPTTPPPTTPPPTTPPPTTPPPTTPPPTTPPPTTPPPTTPPPTTPPPTTPPPTTPPPTTPPPTIPPTVALQCFEVPIEDIYSTAFNCTANTRLVNVMCSFDGNPATNCTFPVVINFLDFNPDPHNLVISVVDVNGQRDQFVYNFTGYVPDRIQIKFHRNMTSAVEGGRVRVIFGRIGYSFGDISVRITPLTYDQFEARGYDLDNFFPARPPAASISDINTTVITDYLQAGFSLFNLPSFIPIPDDTIPETSEGYVYLLEVIGPLHPRDVGRIDNTTSVLLVTINGTDGRIQITMAPREVVITEGEGEALTITRNGFSYGSIPIRVLLLTYDEYTARGFNLDDSYPMRPIPADGGVDFNTSVFDLSFGKSEELIRMSFSTNSDSRSELTEGFLCYLEIIGDQLHPRDVGRIDFFNQLVLVQILDNDAPISCTSAVEENTATIDCTGIDQLPTDSNISCTIDGEPTGCTFPFRIDVSQFRGGQPQHQVRVMTQSPGEPQPQMVGGAQFILPELTLSFVDNTPLLNMDTLTARFVANRPDVQFDCYSTLPGVARENCSSGFFRRTNIPPGVYKLRVVAWDPVRDERAVIRNRILVHRDDTFCAVLKTNNGVTIGRNNNVTVEFSGTGRTTGFQCILDKQQPYFECESPLMLTNLTVGNHHFKIIPQGCGRQYRAYPFKFTIN